MLYGRQVALRPLEPSDLDFLADLTNHPVVRAQVVGWDFPVSRDAQVEWFRRPDRSTRRLAVVSLATGEILGMTGLWDLDWHNQSASTGIKLMPGVAPKGAGSDAIMTLMAWSFYEVGLRRLHCTILDFNAASHGAYVRKCGWQIEGRQREAVFRNGRWNDLLHAAILKREFDTLLDAEEYVGRLSSPVPVPVPSQVPSPVLEPVPAPIAPPVLEPVLEPVLASSGEPELATIWQDLASAS